MDSRSTDFTWNDYLSNKSSTFDNGVTQLNSELELALEKLAADPFNPELLAIYQSRLSEYTLYRNVQSNVVKVYKDVGSAIITNFR
ncbi:type III secretion system needle complex protein [Candidatus Symbiopectobacterium sp. 'North America']|uniref:type III secretion system needle complex protein n=1 Tax=Candidatus Symbiopectobacterium sp. 'North America' TaxID=2794574 RepID=UPI001FD1C686|nr:type III secretion system needle complex protein [Candidatus Symbiopectobacterium sp. 'North America']